MTAVKNAITTALAGDATYLALIGSPSAWPYQTFYMHPPQRPIFPFTVFSLRPQSYFQEYGHTLVSQSELSITVWDQIKADAAANEAIMDRIIYLLHQKPNSAGFRAIVSGDLQELEDHEINAIGLNTVFDLSYRRSVA